MPTRLHRPLSKNEIIACVQYMDLEDLKNSGLAKSDNQLFKRLESGFIHAQEQKLSMLVAYWPDGVFGFVSFRNIGTNNLPAIEVAPSELELTYKRRHSIMSTEEP